MLRRLWPLVIALSSAGCLAHSSMNSTPIRTQTIKDPEYKNIEQLLGEIQIRSEFGDVYDEVVELRRTIISGRYSFEDFTTLDGQKLSNSFLEEQIRQGIKAEAGNILIYAKDRSRFHNVEDTINLFQNLRQSLGYSLEDFSLDGQPVTQKKLNKILSQGYAAEAQKCLWKVERNAKLSAIDHQNRQEDMKQGLACFEAFQRKSGYPLKNFWSLSSGTKYNAIMLQRLKRISHSPTLF